MTFTFNSTANTAYDITLHNYSYSVMPGTDDRLIAMPGRRGVFDQGADLQAGYFTLECSVNESTLQNTFEQVEAIAKWLNPEDGVQTLTFSDRPGRTWYARVIGATPVEQIRKFARFSINFIVPDGVAYGADDDCTGTDSNDGAVACPCTITVTFTGDEASDLTISCGDDDIIIDGPFSNEDVLVIDDGYVTLNGSNNMANVQVSSVFFKLPVGAFTVSDDSANTTLLVEWTELWL